jgi:hypothetical protein
VFDSFTNQMIHIKVCTNIETDLVCLLMVAFLTPEIMIMQQLLGHHVKI